MPRDHQAIIRLREEFSEHVSKNSNRLFQVSPEASAAFDRLTRDLEKKRQVGALTVQEMEWLRDIDGLRKNIADFNRKIIEQKPAAPPVTAPLIYNLSTGKSQEEQEYQKPLIIPKISEEEANRIISRLNAQFEEKIMKKGKSADPALEGGGVSEAPDFGASPDMQNRPDHPGRNLHDYLSAVRQELPESPFSDEDSEKDLSKFAANVQSGQTN